MSEAMQGMKIGRPFRPAKQKAFAEIHNYYSLKKQPQTKSQKKRLEPILESYSVSDGNNNTGSTQTEQISIVFGKLNIDERTTENTSAEVPLTAQPNVSAEMKLDDSVYIIEPKVELNDSFEDTIRSMNFSALSTDDPTDEECEYSKSVNSKIAWSDRTNVRSVVIQQECIKRKVIDTLFGCDSMTVDLFEIFPDIEPELTIRRRSSVHWNTPPRYSVLPKY